MIRSKIYFVLALVCSLLGGCLNTSLTEEWSAPDFGWDTLKRDWIVMTPLLDLRSQNFAAEKHLNELKFLDTHQCAALAEDFKQVFARLRNDIRIFGAGGAFEAIAQLPELPKLGRSIFAKMPLPEADRQTLVQRNQDLRFLLVPAVTGEDLSYDLGYEFRRDQEDDILIYRATRRLRMQMALWDSQKNQTVWIGTKDLVRVNDHRVAVRNPSKVRKTTKKDGKLIVEWIGSALSPSLSEELRARARLFPAFPGRTGLIESTFKDFALSLPMDSSEEKLLEYSYFTYHRPALSLRLSQLGNHAVGEVGVDFSSIIANRYRFGGFISHTAARTIEFAGERYEVSGGALGLTADREWTLNDRLRILTGAELGFISYVASSANLQRQSPDEDRGREHDTALFLSPRLRLLSGARQGFQWGGGVSYRLYRGIESQILKTHRPSPWAAELMMAYTIRGF